MNRITATEAGVIASSASLQPMSVWDSIRLVAQSGQWSVEWWFGDLDDDAAQILCNQLREAGFRVFMRWELQMMEIQW